MHSVWPMSEQQGTLSPSSLSCSHVLDQVHHACGVSVLIVVPAQSTNSSATRFLDWDTLFHRINTVKGVLCQVKMIGCMEYEVHDI